MENRIITCVMIVAAIMAATISGGCMEKSGVEVEDVAQVQGYADSITEQILVAMNGDDYSYFVTLQTNQQWAVA